VVCCPTPKRRSPPPATPGGGAGAAPGRSGTVTLAIVGTLANARLDRAAAQVPRPAIRRGPGHPHRPPRRISERCSAARPCWACATGSVACPAECRKPSSRGIAGGLRAAAPLAAKRRCRRRDLAARLGGVSFTQTARILCASSSNTGCLRRDGSHGDHPIDSLTAQKTPVEAGFGSRCCEKRRRGGVAFRHAQGAGRARLRAAIPVTRSPARRLSRQAAQTSGDDRRAGAGIGSGR